MPQETQYTQYPDVAIDGRLRYFDGQFLGSQDFTDEQRYHVDRLRRLTNHLRIAGITSGLTVAASGALKVTIAPGTAIDGAGRQLVVPAPLPFALPGDVARPAGYVLALRFAEREDRTLGGRDSEPGTRGDTRFREEPVPQLHPESQPLPDGDVALALLAVAADGTIAVSTPPALRRYSGLRLPGPGDQGPRLYTGGDPDPLRLHLDGSLNVLRDMHVASWANLGGLHVRAQTFKLGGAGDKFYPVVFVDDGWTDGAFLLELTRASTHADREWWGSLVARLRVHASNFGHGSESDEIEVYQAGRIFVARYAVVARARELVVWLRGDTTYQWRAGQAAGLVYAEPAETTRHTETLPVLAAVDPPLDRGRYYIGPARDHARIRSPLVVHGDLTYDGRLNKLDTHDVFAAIVRSADFNLGHSSRRGNPGRALVDAKDVLSVNHGADWPRVAIGSPLDVNGDITYAGVLAKLITAEQGAATIRAADLVFGHSTRRGSPGRALVDAKTDLVVNYGPDWPKVAVDGELHALRNLRVNQGATLNAGANPLNVTAGWSGTPDAATNVAELSNDTGTYKTLMIVGNRSAGIDWPGSGRRVSVWDRLEVNGHILASTSIVIGLAPTSKPIQPLHVNGRMYLESGVIQRGGTEPVTGTSDLGLYSQVQGHHVRYVSKSGRHQFFNDGGIGTTSDFEIQGGNTWTRLNHSADSLTVRKGMRVEELADLGPVHLRAQSFALAGDPGSFYPVLFRDLGWEDGPCTVEISRSDVHRDASWHGSLSARFTFHNTKWGHGSEFDEVRVTQLKKRFIARYQLVFHNTEIVVWLRGGTTYSWRSNHKVELTHAQPAQAVREGVTFPVLTAVDAAINYDRYQIGAALETTAIRSNLGVGTSEPAGPLDVRVPGCVGSWDRLVVTAGAGWGDAGAKHVTIGAGGAYGIMASNLHVPWFATENRASIRYGRTGGQAGKPWWDLGLRNDGDFTLHVTDSGSDGEKLRVKANGYVQLANNGTVYSGGRLHIHGEELLYILNKSGVVIGKDWGGNGNLTVQGNTSLNAAGNPINFTSGWSGTPDAVNHVAEISNDTGTYKTLMIVGNKSAGLNARRVSVWDRLEVNGTLHVTSTMYLGEWTLEASGDCLYFKHKGSAVARLHSGWDKLLVYRHSNGAPPYFYFNNGGSYGVHNG